MTPDSWIFHPRIWCGLSRVWETEPCINGNFKVRSYLLLLNVKICRGTFKQITCKTDYCYFYNYFLLQVSFPHQRSLVVFHCSLSDRKFPQIYRTLLRILGCGQDVFDSPFWFLVRPFFFPNIWRSFSMAPTTSGIFVFDSFLSSRARSKYLAMFSPSFIFTVFRQNFTLCLFFFILASTEGFYKNVKNYYYYYCRCCFNYYPQIPQISQLFCKIQVFHYQLLTIFHRVFAQ